MAARADLLKFLRKNKVVFAWSYEYIPGIDPRVISHKLNVDPIMHPVKQKKRTFALERNEAAAKELGEFDIEYKPQIAIKAQVLADFLAEYTYLELEEPLKEEPKPWVLQVDGSTTREASRAGLILTSPKGQHLSYALRIRREENIEADYLEKLATAKEDAIPWNTPVRYFELPSILAPNIQVQAIDYNNSWTGPIVEYITNGTLPNGKVKAR
ncbi:hypothetical protein RHSIM_Rhsim11G0038800 [Rhododendron simsii]|uniref:Reverse transcriptase/retrotransposon-derived protein RNase H-like domain-containing protein n=1 Tax=Rhododendron simsii TaxID=118357 RepID=A0A834G6K8_RHOSS|nr:hypothetical protein RHSIM_Rhsim11G0038800 [Rhododendron simsii]